MIEQGLAPTTINTRLYALRSVVRAARFAGLITWGLEVPGLRTRRIKDTRGPGRRALAAMLAAASGNG